MKTGLAILLLIGLLGSPLGCVASCPLQSHDCCSTHSQQAICPYDILSLAKAVPPAVPVVCVEPVAVVLVALSTPVVSPRLVDAGDLCLSNRVLRI